ncbi:MAG: hypothetical protein KKA73_19700 [Chloroflexi bacterium]|nr:hypothetical protein [Chloroflexota bacterium]MBU1749913.1 hypothetical protein [Chloroflexota bacterium]
MNAKGPQLIMVAGVIMVILVGLLLAGGADMLFPAPTPTPLASFTPVIPTAKPTNPPTPTTQPIAANLVVAYTNDTQGYMEPCNT